MSWQVTFSRSAEKAYKKLPQGIQDRLDFLVREMMVLGPVRGNWKNYSKLGSNRHHCHLKTGRPTYVACWEVVNQQIKLIEVYYAGTHEKAPY